MGKKIIIISLTTDGFYRAITQEIEYYQKEGVLCIEMEAAAIFAVVKFRDVKAIALFTVTDSYANLKWEKSLDYKVKKNETLNKMFEIALKVM